MEEVLYYGSGIRRKGGAGRSESQGFILSLRSTQVGDVHVIHPATSLDFSQCSSGRSRNTNHCR
jgi:hypothetical protein